MTAKRDYAAPVRELLGELAAVDRDHRQQPQDARPHRLPDERPRPGVDAGDGLQREAAAARHGPQQPFRRGRSPCQRRPALLGDGQLVLTLHSENAETPYQSVVPLAGDSVAAVFEHYLEKSEQQPARLWLMADADAAPAACSCKSCRMPTCLTPTAGTASCPGRHGAPEELLLAPETLLTRLFAEESVRLYPPRPASWHCPRDVEKVRNMLFSLGREEIESMLEDAEIIAVEDEICGHEYRFGPEILDELFPPEGRTLH
jgi:molecular chaperone Hsp33